MTIIRVIKKYNSILSSHQKFRIFELVVLMILGGLLEMCSVSLVIPFMNAVLNPEVFFQKWYAKLISQLFRVNSSRMLLVVLAIILALMYIVKNLYLLFQINVQYRFVYGNMLDMQKRMLSSYMNRPYEYYLSVDSGEIIRVMNSDIPNAFSLLTTVLSFVAETIVSVMLVVTILVITPLITVLMAVVLLTIMLVLTAIVKPILNRAGKDGQGSQAKMNKWLMQAIQGIKEIKVTHREYYFQKMYADNGAVFVDTMRKNLVLGSVPRFFIEAVSMSAMFIVIAVLIFVGRELDSIIPMITAVGVAAIRLLPSTNRMATALNSIAYLEPTLDKLIENLTDVDNYNCERVETEIGRNENAIRELKTEISVKNVTYGYPDSNVMVLKDANMTIKKGESVGIVGSSGAGKTTTVDLVLGLLEINKGNILVDDKDVRDDLVGWYGLIGYIPQNIFLMDDTIKANVAFGYANSDVDDKKVWKALKDASLDAFVKSLPDGIYTEIGEQGVRLSGGQRQRIGIARALYRDPQVLIFDEATSALDNETESDIMESIYNLHGQKTMIIIAHRLTTIEKCDCVYRVENGNITKER